MIEDCYHYNNHAYFGNYIYARSKDVIQRIQRIENLNSTEVSTFPSYFEMYGKM